MRRAPLAKAPTVALALALALPGCGPGCGAGPAPAPAVTRGRLAGGVAATRAALVDPKAGLLVPVALGADGAFAVEVPPGAVEPWVVIEAGGGALVRTGALRRDGPQTLRPLGLWRTELRVRREAGRVRIDWAPVPEGEGFPSPVRYSLLVTYRKADGSEHEATLPSTAPRLEEPEAELLEFLPERDPAVPDVGLTIRAFQPDDPSGAWWHGGAARWTLGTERLTPTER